MLLEYDNRNILSEKKFGVTILVFELSAPESEFSTYLRSIQGQITYTYLNEFLFLLLNYIFLFTVEYDTE
jgi:hypothetical protein